MQLRRSADKKFSYFVAGEFSAHLNAVTLEKIDVEILENAPPVICLLSALQIAQSFAEEVSEKTPDEPLVKEFLSFITYYQKQHNLNYEPNQDKHIQRKW